MVNGNRSMATPECGAGATAGRAFRIRFTFAGKTAAIPELGTTRNESRMKKIVLTTLSGILLISATVAILSGCGKHGSSSGGGGTIVSAEKTSFKEVTSKLDSGGSLYFYMDTATWLHDLSGKIDGWKNLVGSLPDDAADREKVNRAFDLASHIVKDSGIEEVSGFGVSSIAREPGVYHTKTLLHHYEKQGNGFVWKLFGDKPHDLTTLNFLSTNTALAMFCDGNVPLAWSVLQKEVGQSGIPEAAEFLDKLPQNFEKGTGLKWGDVLASLGGEFGLVLTLNDSKIISVPTPARTMVQIPAPGLMIVMKVNNDTIFQRVDRELQKNRMPFVSVDKDGLKMRTVPVPIPLPVELRPTIAMSGGYLFIATSDVLVQDALAVKSGAQPGLKTTEEFKRLSADVPTDGNEFCYVSPRFSRTVSQVQKSLMAGVDDKNATAKKQLFEALFDPDRAVFSYSVFANTDEGFLTIGNGNQHPGTALVAAVAIVPIIAAVAVPGFTRARERAQRITCINNLRRLDGAKQQWALENNKKEGAVPTQAELQLYLGGSQGTWPTCPKGGHYTIGSIGEKPHCSVPDHELPN
jgi:hypothetical protein